jgi:hypothetical protein
MMCGPVARAESLATLPIVMDLLPETDVYVDILDASTEVIQVNGAEPLDVYGPSGLYLGPVLPGETFFPTDGNGAYRFDIPRILTVLELEVLGRTGGRVWSPDWRFDAGTFRERGALSTSVHALVDGGADDADAVVTWKLEGFAGFVFRLASDDRGLAGAEGRSVPFVGQVYEASLPIYLEPPEKARRNPIEPVLGPVGLDASFGDCEGLALGAESLTLTFESNVRGTAHIVCDIDENGIFDVVGDSDFQILRPVVQGPNTLEWDGTTAFGDALPEGRYACQVLLTVGEHHFVAYDVETSYPGFRYFESLADGSFRGLPAFWDDGLVQGNDLAMPNGAPSLATSGPFGLYPGRYDDPADPLANARAWGSFVDGGKGNEAWLDTFTWIDAVASEPFLLTVFEGLADQDVDDLTDAAERCRYGTDPLLPDSDADGLRDGREVRGTGTDPVNPDTDGDCVLDGAEVPADYVAIDSDGDGLVDPLDGDDDGDGIATRLESCGELEGGLLDGDLSGNDNVDADAYTNRVDRDSDADGYTDQREGVGDRDGDGNPDFLDPDTIGLGGADFGYAYYAGGCDQRGAGSAAGPGVLAMALAVLGRRRRR